MLFVLNRLRCSLSTQPSPEYILHYILFLCGKGILLLCFCYMVCMLNEKPAYKNGVHQAIIFSTYSMENNVVLDLNNICSITDIHLQYASKKLPKINITAFQKECFIDGVRMFACVLLQSLKRTC